MIYHSHSPEDTRLFAAKLAACLKAPILISLEGDLAVGKTCFVSGLVQALDPKIVVSSPTYTLAQTYKTTPPVHHIDLFRVQNQNLEDLGILELIENSDAIVCVEWPKDFSKQADLRIILEDLGENQRQISLLTENISLLASLSNAG